MDFLELSWNSEATTLKALLQGLFASSGQLLKRHYSSKELAREVRPRDRLRVPLDLANHLKINPHFVGPRCSIIAETTDYLVLHKPPGVHCHPLCYSDRDTLLNFLAQERKWAALAVNAANYDRGLLYRLDFETSGVVMVAKTEAFLQRIRSDFSTAMKKKIYLAIVEGDFDRPGTWTHYFRATGLKGAKQALSESPKGDALPGTLKVTKLKSANGKSLVQVELQTGLRHQIRAQLAFLGFPILGDELYGGKKAERLFLHALHYEGEWGAVEDPHAEGFSSYFAT